MTKAQSILLGEIRELKKGFSRLLGFGILFIFIGQLFIVEPYFSYKKEQKILDIKLKESQDRYRDAKKQFLVVQDLNKKTTSALDNAKYEIKKFPRELREKLSQIKREVSNPTSTVPSNFSIQQQRVQSSTQRLLPDDIKTFEKGVQWYTKDRFTKIIDRLKREVIKPLVESDLITDSKLKDELEPLTQKAIDNIFTYINNLEKQQPNFWHTYRGKGLVADELDRIVNDSFKPIYIKVKETIKMLKEISKSQNEQFETLKEEKNSIEKIKNSLENRLKSLQSPIGKIPVGLTDFIKLFPILIVILMVMVTLHISKSRYIHQTLEKNISQIDEDETTFRYVIGCWYLPPYLSIQYLLLTSSIFLIIATYFRSIFLVSRDSTLFSVIQTENSIQFYLYIASYIVGTLILFWSLGSIQKATSSRIIKT